MENERAREKLVKWAVKSPLTYRLLRPVLDLLTRKNDNEPFKIWVRFLLDAMNNSYARKQPVVWMSAFTPSEIAYGMGYVPFMPEIIASVVTYLGKSKGPIALANAYASSDLCSFHRCALGLVMEDYLPKPDLIISSSYLCEGANKFFHYLASYYRCPHLMVDAPYRGGSAAKKYVADQLKELVDKSSRLLGLVPDMSVMSQALELSNKARAYIAEINRLRRSRPSPFPGSEGLSYLAGMVFYSLGSKWGVDFFKTLHLSLEQKVAKGEGYLPEEKYRLLWLHHIRPYYKNEIFKILEEKKAAVSFEETNYLYWPALEPSKPYESLADKIISNIWAGSLERRVHAIEEMVEEYDIDGVIHFSHWGCRQSCGGAAVVGDVLKQKGLPYIVLPGDGADPDNFSPGQTRTRLEALIEMLG